MEEVVLTRKGKVPIGKVAVLVGKGEGGGEVGSDVWEGEGEGGQRW